MPRLRGRVPVVGAVRSPDGRRRARRSTRTARPTRPWARRAAEWLGYRLVLPRHWLLLASRGVAARARATPAPGSGAPPAAAALAALARADRSTRRAGGEPDAWFFTGLRDGRVAARHAPGRAARDARRPARDPALPGPRRRLLRRAAPARGTRGRRTATRPRVDRVDARRRAGRRRQRGLRRGDEGLRPPARHRRGGGVRAPGQRLLRVGRRRGVRCRSGRPAATVVVQDPCHLRHVQQAHGAVRTVLGAGVRARSRPTTTACAAAPAARTTCSSPSSPPTSATARSPRSGARPATVPTRSSRRRTRAAACTCAAAGLDVRHPADLLADGARCLTAPSAYDEHRRASSRTIEEELRDLAYDRLREAAADSDDGAAARREAAPQARRAVERAINALAARAGRGRPRDDAVDALRTSGRRRSSSGSRPLSRSISARSRA